MFYGWRVVTGAFVGMVLANGLFTYAFTVLVNPIRQEFGASMEQVMYSLTIGTLLGLVVAPIVGMLVDRYSVRYLMTVGCAVTAAGLLAMSQVQSIAAFNVVTGTTMALSMAMVSSMPGSAAVSRWFTTNRGKALGIASMGTSLGGVIVPVLLSAWVENYGWRVALQYLSVVAAVVVMPLVWYCVRSRPQDVGLLPEGLSEPPPDSNGQASSSLGMGQIVRMRAFWLIGLSMGCVFAAFSSMLANLAPYAARLGTDESAISMLIAVLSIGGLVGKLVFGTAADRINLKLGLWSAHLLLSIAFLILLFEPAYPWLLIASVCFGLSTGGLLPVWNAMVVQVFGVDSFGRAMGAMGPVITLSILPAFAVVGRLFDTTGDYSLGLGIFTGVIFLGAFLLVPLRLR